MMIGDNRDEYALYEGANPNYGKMTVEQVEARLKARFGERYDAIVAAYSEARQTNDPWALYIGIMSNRFHRGTIMVSSVHAELALVYRYSFDFNASEKFGPAHGAEIAFAFSNASSYPNAMPGAESVEDIVSDAWLSFARDGDPNHEGMPVWPVYNNEDRPVMVFDAESRVINDPRAQALEWAPYGVNVNSIAPGLYPEPIIPSFRYTVRVAVAGAMLEAR